MLHDQLQYLPGDLLAKVDRASMWVSLEARVPLLDHQVVEFSWAVPATMKIRDGETKWPLRQLALRYLPRELLDRPKMGFTVPLDRWLQVELAPWVEAVLDSSRLADRGLWNLTAVSKIRRSFRVRPEDFALPLWAILVLEDWCGTWGVTFSGP